MSASAAQTARKRERATRAAEMYRRGTPCEKIALTLGCDRTSVYGYLRAAGIQTAGYGNARKLTDGQEQQLIALYQDGVAIALLREQFGVSRQMIYNVLRRNGSGSAGRTRHRAFAPEQIADMTARWEAGKSQADIAAAYRSDRKTIRRALSAAGVNVETRPRPTGERHWSWRGGRILFRGYWRVRLPADHAYHSMVNSTGYVAEHRLVMAEHLGRPLLSSERVMLIDGDRQNSQLANLRLGRSRPRSCAACGGHDSGSR